MCVRAPAQPRIDRAEPVADMFWGDRFGRVTDPFGVRWGIATHTEDVSPEEISRRAAEAFKQT
jgi:PhnB protein